MPRERHRNRDKSRIDGPLLSIALAKDLVGPIRVRGAGPAMLPEHLHTLYVAVSRGIGTGTETESA